MTETVRLIIAGGRKFCSTPAYPGAEKKRKMMPIRHIMKAAFPYIDNFVAPYLAEGKRIEVVSGRAMGADTVGELWQQFSNDVDLKLFPVTKDDWNIYGPKAGIYRNIKMGDYADVLLDFWDGNSPGSTHMIEYAKELKMKTLIVPYKTEDYP